ncbi:MAG TPA: hypothetical protein VGB24_10410 [Longimicrobium sp.]|jgi:hypothetical protein|uniref:hypothetical protein n=1 Tax=Longimicrobium sp. TaxID=2029185 RepID=UPI002EDB661C
MMHVAQAQTRTPDPWTLFGTDLEPAPVPIVAPVEEAPREAPHARITLRTMDGDVAVTVAAAWTMLAFLSLVGMFIGWTTDASNLVIAGGCVLVAGAAGARALYRGLARPMAEFVVDERGISQRMLRLDGAEVTALIPWDAIASYRDSESLDSAYLRVVGTSGAAITLRQAPPTDEMYRLIRTFAAEAEWHGVRASEPLAALRSYAPGIGTTIVLLVVMKVVFGFLPAAAEGIGMAVLLLFIGGWNAYAMLSDDDLALEDRQSMRWDAGLRDRTRRLLSIETV